MRPAAPAAARSTEPHPESARLRGWLVLSQCLATPGRVGAPRLSLQAINCRSPRIAGNSWGGWCGRDWSATIRAAPRAGSGESPLLPVTSVPRGQRGGRWPIAWRLLRRTRVDPGSPRRRRCPLPQRGAPRSRRQTALRRPTCRQVVAPGEPWPGDRSGRRRAAALRRRSALRRVQIAAGAPAARWRRSLLRRRSRAWQPAVRFRIGARGAQDRRSRLRRRSPAWQPAVRYRSGGPAAQGSRLRWRSPADRRADRFRLR